jgi:Galactose oxidase, central domain
MKQPCVLMSGLVICGIAIVFLAGCGSGAASTVNNQAPAPAVPTVIVSPAVVIVQAGGAQGFMATVIPSGAAVTWSVSGTGCAGTSCGTIEQNGAFQCAPSSCVTYTAPVSVPDPATVTLTVADADLGKSASATVTIQASSMAPGTFTGIGNMTTARSSHTATLLKNGKVLIAGGSTSLAAELYDPSTGTFTATGNMISARQGHTATLLPDGKVLIAGGADPDPNNYAVLSTAELYDPDTGTFTRTGDMNQGRTGHSANLLASGKVLITGGFASVSTLADAELYDPAVGTFVVTGGYAIGGTVCDYCPPDTLLSDGRVLFAEVQPAQLYDPVSGTFSVTGASIYDAHTTATLLKNDKVLLTGGETDFGRSALSELYDPSTETFSSTSDMTSRRVWHSATLLPDGMVLIAGGETDSCTGNSCVFAGTLASAELYDPATGAFAPTGNMTTPRERHTATLLPDGSVLITGGAFYGGIGIFYGSLANAELYSPASATTSSANNVPKNSAAGKCLESRAALALGMLEFP